MTGVSFAVTIHSVVLIKAQMDNTRLRQEFGVQYAPFRQRAMEIINEVRKEERLPLVRG